MIQIDVDADLNMVDDADRNMANLPANAAGLEVGGVAVAGRRGFWSWVVIEEITDTSVFSTGQFPGGGGTWRPCGDGVCLIGSLVSSPQTVRKKFSRNSLRPTTPN